MRGLFHLHLVLLLFYADLRRQTKDPQQGAVCYLLRGEGVGGVLPAM